MRDDQNYLSSSFICLISQSGSGFLKIDIEHNTSWDGQIPRLFESHSSGWPIDAESVAKAGVACAFSRCYAQHANPNRTRASQVRQIGNAMNVNTIGAVLGAVLTRYPEIYGARLPTGSSPKRKRESSASSAPATASSPEVDRVAEAVANLRSLKRRLSK